MVTYILPSCCVNHYGPGSRQEKINTTRGKQALVGVFFLGGGVKLPDVAKEANLCPTPPGGRDQLFTFTTWSMADQTKETNLVVSFEWSSFRSYPRRSFPSKRLSVLGPAVEHLKHMIGSFLAWTRINTSNSRRYCQARLPGHHTSFHRLVCPPTLMRPWRVRHNGPK